MIPGLSQIHMKKRRETMKKKFLAGILSFMLAVQPAAICQAEEVAGSEFTASIRLPATIARITSTVIRRRRLFFRFALFSASNSASSFRLFSSIALTPRGWKSLRCIVHAFHNVFINTGIFLFEFSVNEFVSLISEGFHSMELSLYNVASFQYTVLTFMK